MRGINKGFSFVAASLVGSRAKCQLLISCAAAIFSITSLFAQSSPSVTRTFVASTVNETAAEAPPGAFVGTWFATPTDTTGAVGRDHVMSAANFFIRVQDRDGNVVSETFLPSFWDNLLNANGAPGNPAATSPYDPVITYDPLGRRWIFVCNSDARANSSRALIAVSKGDNPSFGANIRDSWWGFIINTGDARLHYGAGTWLDQPSLGFNRDLIAVASTAFTVPGFAGISYQIGCSIIAINKTAAYRGALSFSAWRVGARRLAPAKTLDGSELLHCVDFGSDLFGSWYEHSTLRLLPDGQIAYREGLPNVYRGDLGVPTYFGFADGNGVGPQFGVTTRVDLGDDRLHSVVARDGRLIAANRILVNDGGGASQIQWMDINTSTWTANQFGRFGPPGVFLSYPTPAINAEGDVLIGFTVMSPSIFPSAGFAFRAVSDPTGVFRPFSIYRPGGSPSNVAPPTGDIRNRFGDYSATCVDPVDDRTMWTLQTSTAALPPVNRFQYSWAAVVPPNLGNPVINSSQRIDTSVNSSLSVQMVVQNLPAVGAVFELTGSHGEPLPPWISINADGLITITRVPAAGHFDFRQIVRTSLGASDNKPLTITVVSSSLADAIDYSFRSAVTSRGPFEWFRETNETSDGHDAARSGPVGDGQGTSLYVDIQGPTRGTFQWKCDAEPGDRLIFHIDGHFTDAITGSTPWRSFAFEIPEGAHRLEWRYLKDGSRSAGRDCGWVDRLEIENQLAPAFLNEPPPIVRWMTGEGGLFDPPISGEATRFEWIGDLPSGLTFDAKTGKISGKPAVAGLFPGKLRALNAAGSDEISLTLQVADLPLSTILNIPKIQTTTSSPKGWTADISEPRLKNGDGSAASAVVNRGESTWMESKIDGPASVSFWWKVDAGTVTAALDGVDRYSLHGQNQWTQQWLSLLPGPHVLRWTYTYDGPLSGEQAELGASFQSAWVDDMEILAPQSPKIELSMPVKANRFSPLEFHPIASFGVDAWKLDGTLPEGLVFDSDDGSISGSPEIAGVFPLTLFAINAAGSSTFPFSLEVDPSGLGPALGTPFLFPETDSKYPWFAENSVTPGTPSALQSAASLPDGVESWIQVHVDGPSLVQFDWRASSGPGINSLQFLIDGELLAKITGETDWTRQVQQVPPGDHVLRWSYSKTTKGADDASTGWLAGLSINSLQIPEFRSAPAAAGRLDHPFFFVVDLVNSPNSVTVPDVLPPGINFDPSTLAFSGIPTKSGAFPIQIVASNGAGETTQNAQIIIESDPLEVGLDTSGFIWSTSPEAPWFVQTETSQDTIDAAQSGWLPAKGPVRNSWLEMEASGSGVLTFWWKLDGAHFSDSLILTVDGVQVALLDESGDWEQETIALEAGTHHVRWTDSRFSRFGASWVDQVRWKPGPDLPSLPSAFSIDGVFGEALKWVPPLSGGTATSFELAGDWPIG
ncbi:MAG: hypothetical protein JWM99_79, partial [Verrucomicrobiales bacterium]|nr:hypothetical protein [Verrucomicrobiales bacterium]